MELGIRTKNALMILMIGGLMAGVWYRQHERLDNHPARAADAQSDGPRRRLPPIAVFQVLDRNGDARLSKAEILDAPAALEALDVNRDGKVSDREIGWPPYAQPVPPPPPPPAPRRT